MNLEHPAPPPRVFTPVAIALHWLVALLICAGFGLGLTMTGMAFSPQKLKFYSWHKWIGVTVFLGAALRLWWRLGHPAPALPAAMPPLERALAQGAHGLLYVLFFVIPLSGWLYSSSKGLQTVYLGVLPLPDLLSKEIGDTILANTDAEKPFLVSDLLRRVHVSLDYFLAVVVAGHVLAAFKHYFYDRDDVLTTMIPALKPRAADPSNPKGTVP